MHASTARTFEPAAAPPIRFLLVDDLTENLLALQALLEREGLELLSARSGRDALELLLEHEIELAIIDVHMPGMDGFELAELMRGAERTRHVPIIFVTAGSRDRRRLFKGYDAGAVDFLFKPIEPRVLKNKVETFYQLSRQRQQLAAQLREREILVRELGETLRLNETFVAAIGHELRNPLSTVVTGSEAICQLAGDARLAGLAARVRASGERMSRILDELYDLARARVGGGIPLERRDADLAALAASVIEDLTGKAPERAIVLERSGELVGLWDPDRLSQVLTNLVGNAVRHASGPGPIRVCLDGDDARRVFASVTNPGQVPPEIAPHLFDPFRSGRLSAHRSDGLGLGLYIVQQIVRAHGGDVRFESTEATGTVFFVELPREV